MAATFSNWERMPTRWMIEKNTGNRALLSHHLETKEMFRPKTLTVEEFCELLKPGTDVLDRVVQIIESWR